ncbi:MAG: hypothetical protein U0361_19070 [Nitrospiraceae bacterium]
MKGWIGKEIEADTLGEEFAARVGYDAGAYVTLLSRLRDLKGDDRALFKTHPISRRGSGRSTGDTGRI